MTRGLTVASLDTTWRTSSSLFGPLTFADGTDEDMGGLKPPVNRTMIGTALKRGGTELGALKLEEK